MEKQHSESRLHRYLAALPALVLPAIIFGIVGYWGFRSYVAGRFELSLGVPLVLLSLGAGTASFFSPCSFPLLVTFLARGGMDRTNEGRGPSRDPTMASAQLALGVLIFFMLLGVLIALGGGAIAAQVTFSSFPGRVLRVLAGISLLAFGLMQLGRLPNPLERLSDGSHRLLRRLTRGGASPLPSRTVAYGFLYVLAGFG
jgi:cytochrome c biogenesis protein CcdA